MRQHHPLENPSLAPYGFTFPNRQKRLAYKPKNHKFWVNEERLIARVWDRRHRADALKPLPIQTIIHDILPSLATANRITEGDFWFDGLPYLTRGILVLSSTVYWFGTNVGRCYLETDISGLSIPGFHPEREFRIKFAQEMERKDMVAFLTHVCTSRCGGKVVTLQQVIAGRCYFDSSAVSLRDRALIDGLMFWLGKKAGRAFIADYSARKANAWTAAYARQHEEWEKKRLGVST
ncbi:MAG: hypothetical protein Q8L30_01545 [bacterium]|nr:hypothetical protein [bacterium]